MNIRKLVWIAIAIGLVGLAIGYFWINSAPKSPVGVLVVGFQNSPSNSLIIIADEMNLFDTTIVKVQVKEFSAGKLALQALLGQSGDLDVAVCAETPIALSTLSGNKLKVFSQIVNAKNECRVVVRKDSSGMTPQTYFAQKRKLATSLGGSPEWLTYRFIQDNGIDKANIEIISMLPENMPLALENQSVDAISIFDPYARIAEQAMGEQGATFLNAGVSSYYVMSTRDSVLASKRTELVGLIKGLSKAAEFIQSNPSEAKSLIAKRTKLDLEVIEATWTNYNFAIGIEPGLNSLLEAEAKWAIESGKQPAGTKIPDFGQVIFKGLLDEASK